MDVINLNHLRVLSTSSTTDNPVAVSRSEEVAGSRPVSISPSTIVSISDEGLTSSFREALRGEAIVIVEKPDEEYLAMSFEDLIDERDGKGKYRADGDTNIYVMNPYGKAAQEAFNRIRAQQMENTLGAAKLGDALNQFRAKLVEADPGIDPSAIDIEFRNDVLVVVGSTLTNSQKARAQHVLENSTPESKTLRNAIRAFNESGLKMINMMIYDERGHYRGVNSEGKAVVHREEPISMNDYVQGVSYHGVARSGGSYTWSKFYELVGSSKWGAGLVFEE